MPNQDFQPPKKITLGRSGQFNRDAPAGAGAGGSRIATSWQEIKWTTKKKIVISIVLGFPYGFALVVCFGTGANIGGYILLGLLAIVGLILLALRLVDRDEF